MKEFMQLSWKNTIFQCKYIKGLFLKICSISFYYLHNLKIHLNINYMNKISRDLISEQYLLNIKKIDDQHREWINIYHEIISYRENHRNEPDYNEYMQIIISKMYSYARYHLKYEENFMKKVGYPALTEHKMQHRVLDSSITDFFTDLFKGEEISDEKLISTIKNWIYSHIMEHDKKISEYIVRNNIDYNRYLD